MRRLPATSDGRQRTVAVARPVADVEATLNVAKWSLGLGALLASLMAVGFALIITRRTLRPLVQVQSAAETVAASQDLSVRIPEGRPDEVGRLARSVNQMLERLEDAQGRLTSTLDEQRRFAADASHELRTPLTALKGDIDLLARYDVPEEEREVVLGEMRDSVERMGRMVEGLLALARTEGAGADTAAEVDLNEVIGEIARGAEWAPAEPLVVPGRARGPAGPLLQPHRQRPPLRRGAGQRRRAGSLGGRRGGRRRARRRGGRPRAHLRPLLPRGRAARHAGRGPRAGHRPQRGRAQRRHARPAAGRRGRRALRGPAAARPNGAPGRFLDPPRSRPDPVRRAVPGRAG